ncbi:hypothetical protein [Nocardioides pacificus]
MIITAAPLTATVVRVAYDLSWIPGHAWGSTTTHIDAQLSDGRQLAVATYGDHDLAGLDIRVGATHEWLHYGVLVLDDDGIPTLVVPVDRLNEGVIAEAVRRWLLGQRRAEHATAS